MQHNLAPAAVFLHGEEEMEGKAAKAHIRVKVEHPFRVIKHQFGFQKTRLRGMTKSRCKINGLAARTNLFLSRRQLLLTS